MKTITLFIIFSIITIISLFLAFDLIKFSNELKKPINIIISLVLYFLLILISLTKYKSNTK